ncbi:protein of unknown function [Maridesulfovibrio hydrothermalis AM13 = DSM 14728]|uniref:Uncharacterized protein n=1 Tax=Maridesulfovibrio hydrothermalis AM13 = DSM 14728 TaxID=1121451 RepID=L0RBV0_9BACT|nr:protein of unknown function [Maridesulfovibrio hydrothermalis AM13 = DSM 14728]
MLLRTRVKVLLLHGSFYITKTASGYSNKYFITLGIKQNCTFFMQCKFGLKYKLGKNTHYFDWLSIKSVVFKRLNFKIGHVLYNQTQCPSGGRYERFPA